MNRLVTLALLLCCSLACDRLEAGEVCETEGDGFTRVDPCEETCVEWAVTCPSGAQVTPGVCSGGPCTSDAECAADELCLAIDMTDSECLPASLCP